MARRVAGGWRFCFGLCIFVQPVGAKKKFTEQSQFSVSGGYLAYLP